MRGARSTLAFAAAFLLAGAAFDSPSLYVPGVALALVVVVSRLWVGAAARNAALEADRGAWTIVEGEPYPIEVRVRARVPLPGGRLFHPLSAEPIRIGPRSPRNVRIEVRSLRRGRHHLEPPALVVSDPFGLHTAEVAAGGAQEVLVLPRIEPVVVGRHGAGAGGHGTLDGIEGIGAGGLDTRPIDFEIDGLRAYRHGSPASRIHWPTVARIGEVVEHRLVSGADSSPLVVLDSSRPADDDALDRAVRAAASLCVHLAPRGGCALLLSGERRARQLDSQLRTWPQIHARLATVEGAEPPPHVRRVRRATVVFWVSAATAPRAVAALAPATYVVAPAAGASAPPAFTVAGCEAHRLGSRSRARLARAGAA